MKIKTAEDKAIILRVYNGYDVLHSVDLSVIQPYIDNEQYIIVDKPLIRNNIVFDVYIERKDVYVSQQKKQN